MTDGEQNPDCPDCKTNKNVIIDSRGGQLVCTGCGLVIGGYISPEAEWRNFSENDRRGADPNRIGAAQDTLTSEGASMLTRIEGTEGIASAQLRMVDAKDRKMQTAFAKIRSNGAKLNLPRDVIATSCEIYKQVIANDEAKSKNMMHICAACLYITAKACRAARPLTDVCQAFGIAKKQLSRAYFNIQKLKNQNKIKISFKKTEAAGASQLEQYAMRFGSKLRLPPAVIKCSQTVCQNISKYNILTGRQPATVSSAALFLAMALSPDKKNHRSWKEIGMVTGMAESTIMQVYRKFVYPERARLVPFNPAGSGGYTTRQTVLDLKITSGAV